MSQTKIVHLAMLSLLVLFASCDGLNPDKQDTNPLDFKDPMVTILNPEVVPIGTMPAKTYGNGDTIQVKIAVEDNFVLKDWEIEIMYRGDIEYMKTAADPMAKTFVGGLVGDEDSINFTITIDVDPWAGPYEFTVTVRDTALNTKSATTYLQIRNNQETIAPTIFSTSPNSSMVDTFGIGSWIPVQGTISDNNSALSDGLVRVRNTFSHEVLDSSERWLSFPGPSHNLDESIYIPPVTPGDYQVEIFAHDSTKNVVSKIIPIYISTN